MMNMQIPKEKWKLLQVELANAWEELSADEIAMTHGSVKSIYGLVQQKCGLHQEEVKDKLTALLKKYDSPSPKKSA